MTRPGYNMSMGKTIWACSETFSTRAHLTADLVLFVTMRRPVSLVKGARPWLFVREGKKCLP